MSEKKRKAKWQNDYIARAYDRINLTVPKGRKMAIEERATENGESVNGYLNRLIRADLKLSETEWKESTPDS